jgi:hypothetical protein
MAAQDTTAVTMAAATEVVIMEAITEVVMEAAVANETRPLAEIKIS